MTRLAWTPKSSKRPMASVWERSMKMVLWEMVSSAVTPPLEVTPLTWSPAMKPVLWM